MTTAAELAIINEFRILHVAIKFTQEILLGASRIVARL